MSIFDELASRGFIAQCTDETHVRKLLANERVTYYAGFDPTARSLHAGSLVPLMAMAHLQHAGHHPIAIIGGATALIGDPSGKTELRTMLSPEEAQRNIAGVRGQITRFLRLDGDAGTCLDNADWLGSYGYIEFLRDVGIHFRVNDMLRSEAYRSRLEREEGLTFIEFNYQLLQAYDFLHLFRRHGCTLQIGGNDQWGNIVAGTDLIRRVTGTRTHGLTFPLLTTAGGAKMGKTERGAVWLDPSLTSPFEYYQYWRNVDDRDVNRFMKLFTFLPIAEIEDVCRSSIMDAKTILAREATAVLHGREHASTAESEARELFRGGSRGAGTTASIPTTRIPASEIEAGIMIGALLHRCSLTGSIGQAMRLVAQGGVSLNDVRVDNAQYLVGTADVANGVILIRKGKKTYHQILIAEE